MKINPEHSMLQRKYILHILITCLLLNSCSDSRDKSISILEKGFIDPPLDARPRGYWCWINGNVDTGRLTIELEEAKEKGMGGYDIWDVRPVVDEKNVVPGGPPFMSEPSVDAIVYAIREAGRLGLDIGLTYSSGWNAGGPWTRPEHATMGLFRSHKFVEGPGEFNDILDFPELPDRYSENNRWIQRGDDGKPVFYRDIAVLAYPYNENKTVPDTSSIFHLTHLMKNDGSLHWIIPPGKWVISRYVCANTGQLLFSHSANSAGPMVDHFSAEATEAHIMFFINKLEKKLGNLENTALKYLYGDSYEVRGDLWTPLMQKEFQNRNSYDLTLFLPVFDGYKIISGDVTARFQFDFQQTLSDLIIYNHYKKAREICRQHGIEFVAEAAGPGMPVHNCPFESLLSSGILAWPRGEFWYKHPQHPDYPEDILQVIKGIACASHIYNQKYVEAESFTCTWLWQDGPGDLKSTADRAFCEGLNRIIFHTSPHVPAAAGRPGWIYSFGTIVNTTETWWPKSKPFMDYLARCSYMLQQGNFAGDILYFYGDSAPNFVPPKITDPNFIQGYDYDYTNADVIINRLDVKNGKLILPHGQAYEMLVLPDSKRISLEVIQSLDSLIMKGAVVAGPKPEGIHGLSDHAEKSEQVKEIADRIWGKSDGLSILENSYGKGKVIWGKQIREILKEKNILPDFQTGEGISEDALDFIHRRTEEAEIYFIRNTLEKELYFDGIFRISGRTPELWDPLTGKTLVCHLYSDSGEQTTIPMHLNPYGSVFVVFIKPSSIHASEMEVNNELIFPGGNYTDAMQKGWMVTGTDQYTFSLTDGKKIQFKPEVLPAPITLTGPWLLTFPEDKFAPDSVIFTDLISWTLSDHPGIRYFSGIASYHCSFQINREDLMEKTTVVIDLGDVQEVADVYVNDKQAGILWCKPFRLEITPYLNAGENHLVIEVANVWTNRLCGDARLDPAERTTHTNITRLPNAWSYPMETIPNSEYGLRESGLMGPVIIHFHNRIKISEERL